MTPSELPRLLVDARDACRLLAISDRTLFDLTAPRGPIPCIRIGTGPKAARRYRVADLDAWAAKAAEGVQG